MTHPAETSLALLAGGELGVWTRWRIGRHLAACPQCRRQAEEFRAAREQLRHSISDMPEGVNWDRLAAEIRGNIRVGLAAGECVGPVERRPARPRWQRAVILAPVVVPVVALLLLGVWLGVPRPQAGKAAWVDGTLIEATPGGIEFRQGDRMLSLRQPGAGDVTYAVNAQGTVRARYVDGDSGQVTIHNVYAQ
jgi:anti-sigma factor RsiW